MLDTSTLVYSETNVSWRNGDEHFCFRKHGPCEIDVWGNVFFSQITSTNYNRRNGPAIISPSGGVLYHNRFGQMHRTNGPAIIRTDGSKVYWVNGKHMTVYEFFATYGVV